jgi:DNA-binding response OmpR family regulator
LSKRCIYIIEDDHAINHGIELTLGTENYCFKSFYCLNDVKQIENANLIILDINLPDGSGLDLLKDIRQISDVPILIITANDSEMDEVAGLSLGADDYVKKPFSLMALRLRVQKLLDKNAVQTAYKQNGLEFDFDNLKFYKNGTEIDFSKTEIRLLRCLVENAGTTIPRDKLIEYVWQNQQFVDENALTVSIKRLRDKIESDDLKLIHTVYGIGYVFRWV